MKASSSAPLLSQVKSWQLVGLGISGWVTLYSAAIINWGASALFVGNAQGGCFAATMALAGVEARRLKGGSGPADPLKWASGITTEQVNHTIALSILEQEFQLETPHPIEAELGFGVRAVKAGRTFVFETSRWKEPVIDLLHAQVTEANRKKIPADIACLVSAGVPDKDTRMFAKTHPIQFLAGKELRKMLDDWKPPVDEA